MVNPRHVPQGILNHYGYMEIGFVNGKYMFNLYFLNIFYMNAINIITEH